MNDKTPEPIAPPHAAEPHASPTLEAAAPVSEQPAAIPSPAGLEAIASATAATPVGEAAPSETVSSQPPVASADASAESAAGQTATPPFAEDAARDLNTPDQMPLLQVIEALLFSTDAPLSAGKLAETVGLDTSRPVKMCIEELNRSYDQRQAAYRIEERAGGYQLLTLPQYGEYIQRLMRKKDEGRLTPASLETLAIVSYKQPIIRAEIEAIRGVACGEVLRSLMEHNLVKIVGRAEEVGRPMLYGTTRYFLEVFGLASIKDLPKAEQLKEPK